VGWCPDGDFLRHFCVLYFSASHVQHITDLHLKFVEVPLRLGEEKEEERNRMKLECGPMPNVMVALPNTGGALCSTSQSLADAHY